MANPIQDSPSHLYKDGSALPPGIAHVDAVHSAATAVVFNQVQPVVKPVEDVSLGETALKTAENLVPGAAGMLVKGLNGNVIVAGAQGAASLVVGHSQREQQMAQLIEAYGSLTNKPQVP